MLINDEFIGSIEQTRVNVLNENENSHSSNEGKRIVFPKDKGKFLLNSINFSLLLLVLETSLIVVRTIKIS